MNNQPLSIKNKMEGSNVHTPDVVVVVVPFPAQGHLNQLLHLSHIITSYGIPVHYAGSGPHNQQVKLRLNGWEPQKATQVHFHDFQLPDYKSVPPTTKPDPSVHWPVQFEPLFTASTHLRKPVFELLQKLSLKFRRIVVIHDSLMTTVVQDVKSISNAESYVFIPVSAFTTFLGYWNSLPADKPFELDSDFPRRLPSEEGTVTPEIGKFISSQYRSLGMESGRLYNTSRLIEGQFLELLEKVLDKKQFAIGPLNPGLSETRSNDGQVAQRHRCLKWLDKQERHSVLYVAFGSTTSMIKEQTIELAIGLEKSGQKFIWVLSKADELEERMGEALPEGFKERVMKTEMGMVIEEWAPQLQILAHPAVGGFMSHCGWNSCIESMSMGVPLAAWPMHSEQPKNSLLVSEVLKIAIVVRDWEHRNELVTSLTIENAVRTLMASKEGDEMRKRAAELGRSMSDDGAESRLEMDSFISHITRSPDALV